LNLDHFFSISYEWKGAGKEMTRLALLK
jgi:hypothetical protein